MLMTDNELTVTKERLDMTEEGFFVRSGVEEMIEKELLVFIENLKWMIERLYV